MYTHIFFLSHLSSLTFLTCCIFHTAWTDVIVQNSQGSFVSSALNNFKRLGIKCRVITDIDENSTSDIVVLDEKYAKVKQDLNNIFMFLFICARKSVNPPKV